MDPDGHGRPVAREARTRVDVVCDLAVLGHPSAETVDALARLQLAAARLGLRLRFRDAHGDLVELVAFCGLAAVLPCGGPSAVEPWRQPEQREQPPGVEEEADPGDRAP